jgi:hypothetical protein
MPKTEFFLGGTENGHLGLIEMWFPRHTTRDGRVSTERLYRAFGCSHCSPVDYHQEDGFFFKNGISPPPPRRTAALVVVAGM